MAETVHLILDANGEAIEGDSSQVSLDRENTIECVYYEDNVRTAREAGSGMASGRRVHEAICIKKRIDKSSPLLARALCNNEVVNAKFLFFRPNPAGDGTTEQFFTVTASEGRISGIKRIVPNCIDPASSTDPPLEEVKIVYHTIVWAFNPTGAEHQDSWSDNQ